MHGKNPLASVFIPVRNEEEHIEECLNSLVNQDYPNDKYEIVIVDGKSEDQTREIIKKFMKKHAHIRLIENPELNVSAGRRIGVEESRGKYVIAFSGHSYAEPNFIRKLVTRLEKADEEIAGVGCRHETPPGSPPTARAIGLAMSSTFGGAGTTFKHPDREQVMDSIAFTAYRKEIIDEVGGPSDPDLDRTGNDAELNLRIKEAGYKLLYIPDTTAYHHKKESLSEFFKWSVNYGIARAKIVKKHGWSSSKIYTIPTLLILTLILTGILSFLNQVFFYLFLLASGSYLIAAITSSILASRGHGLKYVPLVMSAYLTEHIGYGLGFLTGILGKDFI